MTSTIGTNTVGTDTVGTDAIGATVLGYPRIGPNRELKRAVERYWAGRLDQAGLLSLIHI